MQYGQRGFGSYYRNETPFGRHGGLHAASPDDFYPEGGEVLDFAPDRTRRVRVRLTQGINGMPTGLVGEVIGRDEGGISASFGARGVVELPLNAVKILR